jgi:hypothetical protein
MALPAERRQRCSQQPDIRLQVRCTQLLNQCATCLCACCCWAYPLCCRQHQVCSSSWRVAMALGVMQLAYCVCRGVAQLLIMYATTCFATTAVCMQPNCAVYATYGPCGSCMHTALAHYFASTGCHCSGHHSFDWEGLHTCVHLLTQCNTSRCTPSQHCWQDAKLWFKPHCCAAQQ